MGKCGEQRSSSAVAGHLTLRSGRRVPAAVAVPAAATCSPTRSRRQQCRGGSSGRRRCDAKGARGGSPRRKSGAAAGARQCCRVVTSQLMLGGAGGRPEQTGNKPVVSDDGSGGDSRRDTLLSGEALKKHQNEAHIVAGRPTRLPPPSEAEMEAFFAAAELAERRRFAETYNYDVALDRPLEGRFEWAPVSP